MRILWSGAVVCAAVAVLCLIALRVDAPKLLGVHPALKPLKFAISIGMFLATIAILMPHVDTSAKTAISLVLVATNAVELGLIVLQAVRGKTSHFNTATSLDASITLAMAAAIVVMLGAIITLACLATFRPLDLAPASALAWRVGLWMILLVAISGFTMVGHGRHTVGAPDGGPGLPVVNWNRSDLRISHFLALHALQVLPLCAWLTESLLVVAVVCVGYGALAIAALLAVL